MALASANSLQQGLNPLPTQLSVEFANRPPVQHITERNRIKQRIHSSGGNVSLMPKMLGS
jgi:hypothetical protein